MKSDFIWMDGEMVPFEKATVHFINPTLHYGLGVFEGIRCYITPKGPAVFRLQEHMQRFIESIHILGVLHFPYKVDDLCQAIVQTIQINKFRECYIRPLMYLEGPLGLNMDNSKPHVGVAAWEWGPYLGVDSKKNGVKMMVSSYTRLHPNINMLHSKVSGNYVNSMLVKTLALRSGYEEAVILDPHGFVAECTGENIFMIRKRILYTPHLSMVLEGLTRDTILHLAADMNIPIKEESFTRDQLYIADEIFISGTAAEIVPVHSVDTRIIGQGKPGPITCELSKAYDDNIHGKGKFSKEWLYFVG